MMDMITKAREMGKDLQSSDVFRNVKMAEQTSDADAALQDMIGEFNLKRIALSREMNSPDKDEIKVKELDTEVRSVYEELMKNEHMLAYQEAKAELDKVVTDAVTIINMSAQGQDPFSIDLAACSGSCGGCSGCD